MKSTRRGFLGVLAGAAAAPMVAKSMEVEPAKPSWAYDPIYPDLHADAPLGHISETWGTLYINNTST